MLTMPLLISLILLVVVALYSIFILINILSWNRLSFKATGAKYKTKISLIVPARNEEKNIGACITSILTQDYPKDLMEIIISDDNSSDGTKQTALQMLKDSGVSYQCLQSTASTSNKKKAIEAAIGKSSGELLIFTDADCVAENTWLSTIVGEYEKTGSQMICGPVAFTDEKNLCQKFQGLEMCGLSLLSGAGINANIPLMCNAANMAYTKAAFNIVEGFKGIENIPTGDDTLMLFKIHKRFPGSISYVKTKKTFVYTSAQPNWKSLIEQRIRWASKGLHSKNTTNSAVSLLVFLSNFLLFIYAILAFIYPISTPILVTSFILKSTVDFLLLTFGSVFFKKGHLLLIFPVAEIITILYTSVVGIIAPYGHYHWKGRKY